MQLAIDAFGPIADNCRWYRGNERACQKKVREKNDVLDAVGNTTAATVKDLQSRQQLIDGTALFAAFCWRSKN
jgi:K(+)-stimulated pyrophosphate-energized sodium pump